MDYKLANTPITVCLVQLRFSSIEALEAKYIPDIQDSFRKIGLEQFKFGKLQRVVKQERGIELENVNVFRFYDESKTELVQITKDEFSYHSYKYPGFEVVGNRFSQLVNIVSDICDFKYVSLRNLGIRYSNLIKGNNWSDYLNSNYFKVNLPDNHSYNDTMTAIQIRTVTSIGDVNKGMMCIQLNQNKEGMRIPSNVATIDLRRPMESDLMTILDIDHFVNFLPNVGLVDAFKLLNQMHEVTVDTFFNLISESAKKEWK